MNLGGATLDEVAAQGVVVDENRLMSAYRAARRYTKIPSSKRPDVVNDYACQVTQPRDGLLFEYLTSYS